MDTQEWLSSNAKRRFPFAEASAAASGIDLEALSNWLLDLRVFVSAHEEVECWISLIEYLPQGTPAAQDLTFGGEELTLAGETVTLLEDISSLGDSYRITLSNPLGIVAVFEAPIRMVTSISDVGGKRYAYDGRAVMMFVPGDGWESPESIGVSDGSPLSFLSSDEIESTTIHPTNVNTDIRGFKGFYLEAPYFDSTGNKIETGESSPLPGAYPAVSFNRIQSGYNILLKKSDEFLDLDLVPGAGEGLYPCEEVECGTKLRLLNGLGPNDQGNVSLEFFDCLRHSGLTEIDPATGHPYTNGIKIYSDCLPCCTCQDYNHVALSISRISAKFKDVNLDLNRVLIRSQQMYDEAVAIINEQSPGLAVVYKIDILPDRVKVHIFNISSAPIYVAMGVRANEGDIVWPEGGAILLGGEELTLGGETLTLSELPPGGVQVGSADFFLEDGQGHVMNGIILTQPPLKDLPPSSQDTGIEDITTVNKWNAFDAQFTVGQGDDFGPIPPGSISTVTFYSKRARALLDELSESCAKLQVFRGGPLGQAVLDGDLEYQAILTNFNELSILSEDCLSVADLGGAEGDDDRYRCTVQNQADSLRRQELRDQLLARKYELAFDIFICGINIMTDGMRQLIADLRALEYLVAIECKDGSFSCVNESEEPEEYEWNCTAPIYGDACQAGIRSQRVRREELYVAIEKVLRDQLEHLDARLSDCLSNGMIADVIESVDISLAAIFGGYNFACNASVQNFEIDRTDEDSGYDCLERVMALVSLSTR